MSPGSRPSRARPAAGGAEARRSARGAEARPAAGGADALLAEISAITAEEQLDTALERAARLLAGLSGAEAAALFVTDAGELSTCGWHPAADALEEGARGEIERAALEAARAGALEAAEVEAETRKLKSGRLLRIVPMTASGWLLGVACLIAGRERGAAKRLEDPGVNTALALLMPRLAWLRETSHAAAARAQYERWFKTLDEQLRVLDRERQKFSAIVQQSDTAVFVADTSGMIRWTNNALAAQRPGSADATSWIGLPCCDVCQHYRDGGTPPNGEGCAVTRALEQNQATHEELRRTEANGVRNRYLTALPITGPEGRAQEVMVMIQDLSDLEVVRRSESRYRLLFDRSGKAIVMVDPVTRRILIANHTADRLAGCERDGLLGVPLSELHTPEEWRRIEPLVAAGSPGPGSAAIECRVRTRDGAERIATVSGTRADLDGREVMMLEYLDVTERRHVEEALRAAEERLKALVANAPVVLFALDRDGTFTLSEGHALQYLGLKSGEIVGRSAYEVYRESPAVIENVKRALAGEEFTSVVDLGRHAFETRYTPLRDAAGHVAGLIGVATDVTERRRLEDQLRQAQKMEAIGRLAGGVAHDFNNLLAAIQGHSELMMGRLEPGDTLHRHAAEVHKAAARGALLTKQLLAFSRKELVAPRALDVNLVVAEMESILRRLIGEQIELETSIAAEPLVARCDRGQLEQVILNLALNARDAMPEGGRLAISVAAADVEDAATHDHPGARPGRHVALTVSDQGCGMDAETQAHLFEPFFTTKSVGKGTGLGLSTVYGIAQQAGGHIRVESEPGRGSTFTVFLPLAEEAPAAGEPERPIGDRLHGVETVLLVEDEEAVRSLVRDALEGRGYRVLVACNGVEALDLAGRYAETIDLLVSDVVMPHMNGGELAQRLERIKPGLRVLFVSGYTDDAIIRHGVLEARTAFLQKPFGLDVLARTVREVLDAPLAPPAEAARAASGPLAAPDAVPSPATRRGSGGE
ncbi:MAG TPA: PAS domain S-box protein [Candidatus Eisenbacteria bacterium]